MYKIFSIAIPNDGTVEDELNRFLSSHRVISLRTQWTMSGETPYEVFTVEYAGANGEVFRAQSAASDNGGGRVDYRKELAPEQFVRYCKMRDERKKIADEEAVKAFVVFTNEQLAAIARIENPTLESIKKIEGVGEARISRYGARILASIYEETKADVEKQEADGA